MTDGPQNSDAGLAEGTCPPPEALVAAVQKARRNGVSPEGETDRPATPEQNGASSPSAGAPSPGPWHTAESREAWARETLAAFRKAAETVWGPNRGDGSTSAEAKASEDPPTDDQGGARSPERPERREEGEAEATPDDPAGMMEALGEPEAEDVLTLAFRRAFFKRRVRYDGRYEKSEQADPDSTTNEPAALPPRPDPSFLWITDQPHGEGPAVGTESLGGERARGAEAFLLRGGGAGPCRLLRRIRQHSEPQVYLKPVFWRRVGDQTSLVADHVDGVWTPQSSEDELRALRERATAINRRIHDVVGADGRVDTGAERRVVQFVATRADAFAPRRPDEDGGDLLYPTLTPLLPPNDSES